MPIPKKPPSYLQMAISCCINFAWVEKREKLGKGLTFENLVSPEQNVLHAAELELVKVWFANSRPRYRPRFLFEMGMKPHKYASSENKYFFTK